MISCTHFLLTFSPPVVPEITFPNNSTIYRVNQTFPVTFECSATGIPAPYINWLLNGVRLEDLPAYNSRISLSDRSEPLEVETENGTIYSVERTLILSNTMDEDSGNYTCEAFNNNLWTPAVTQDFELFVRGTDSALYLIVSHSFSFYPVLAASFPMLNNGSLLHVLDDETCFLNLSPSSPSGHHWCSREHDSGQS